MIKIQLNLVKAAAVICIATCVFDFVLLFLLGNYYPGYSQLKNTMSALGAAVSPVSEIISIWWILLGVVFIFFGIIFRKAFDAKDKSVKFASLLIILYGLGEGIGSGLFKANRSGKTISQSLILHTILGSIGVIAALLLPLIMLKVFEKKKMPQFYLFSWVIFAVGVITMLLFTIRFSSDDSNLIAMYKGLWQRLFLLNLYIYFITISIIMYNRKI